MIINFPVPNKELLMKLSAVAYLLLSLTRYYVIAFRINRWNDSYEKFSKVVNTTKEQYQIDENLKYWYFLYSFIFLPVAIIKITLKLLTKMLTIRMSSTKSIYGLPWLLLWYATGLNRPQLREIKLALPDKHDRIVWMIIIIMMGITCPILSLLWSAGIKGNN